jgi:predicted ester cyclase
MSVEANMDVVRRGFAAIDRHDLDVLRRDLYDPAYQMWFDTHPPADIDGTLASFGAFLAGLPDISHTIEILTGSDDWVTAYITVRGTNSADLMGIPATGRTVEIRSMNLFRFQNGRVIEHRIVADNLGLMQQLGVIPTPGQ